MSEVFKQVEFFAVHDLPSGGVEIELHLTDGGVRRVILTAEQCELFLGRFDTALASGAGDVVAVCSEILAAGPGVEK